MQQGRGEAQMIRYIDDFVMFFQYREDALRVQDALCKRLGKFGLTLAQPIPASRRNSSADQNPSGNSANESEFARPSCGRAGSVERTRVGSHSRR